MSILIDSSSSKEVGKRLKLLRNKLNLTQTEFGKIISKTLSAIQQYESGARNIAPATLLLIELQFNANSSWIENGTGEMFINKEVTDGYKVPLYTTKQPLINTYSGSLDFLKPEYRIASDIIMVSLEDNSMFPLLHKGDTIACKRELNLCDGIFFIKTKDNVYVRNIRISKNNIELISENPEFETIMLNKADIELSGKIIWYGRYL